MLDEEGAIAQVADMICHYIVQHEGAAPGGWTDLGDAYRYVNTGYNAYNQKGLQDRVRVDFALLNELALARHSRVSDTKPIVASRKHPLHPAVAIANQRIARCLNETKGKQNCT
jgi:hypothetical protein